MVRPIWKCPMNAAAHDYKFLDNAVNSRSADERSTPIESCPNAIAAMANL